MRSGSPARGRSSCCQDGVLHCLKSVRDSLALCTVMRAGIHTLPPEGTRASLAHRSHVWQARPDRLKYRPMTDKHNISIPQAAVRRLTWPLFMSCVHFI